MRRPKDWDRKLKKSRQHIPLTPQQRMTISRRYRWNSDTWQELRTQTQALADAAAPSVLLPPDGRGANRA